MQNLTEIYTAVVTSMWSILPKDLVKHTIDILSQNILFLILT